MTTTGSLSFVRGDATDPIGNGPKIIAHIVNDRGAWGRGFVLAISRRWSSPERAYRKWHGGRGHNDLSLGSVQIVPVATDLWVANMVAQHGTQATVDGPPIRYPALEMCLGWLAGAAISRDASVHMPRIGCGLAGGIFEKIGPIIQQELCDRGVRVTIYDL